MASQRGELEARTARTARFGNREVVAFAGCNYLGLSEHPDVLAAVTAGLQTYGLSHGASLATTGRTRAHRELADEIALTLCTERAVVLPDGYLANVALAEALSGRVRIALLDESGHPSLFAAVRAAGIEHRTFRHLDAGDARRVLLAADVEACAIFTDGVFPTEGRLAPLDQLLEILPSDDSVLVVDDCHGLGVTGPRGVGTASHFGLRDRRLCTTASLSKGLGCYGGAVAGAGTLIQRLEDHSPSYASTTPVPAPLALAASAALRILRTEPKRHATLCERVRRLRTLLAELNIPCGPVALPVFVIELGTAAAMARLERELLDDGFYVPHLRYPGTSPAGQIRLTVTAAHTESDLEALAQALRRRLPRS